MNTYYEEREESLRVQVALLNASNYVMWSNDLEIYSWGKGVLNYAGGKQPFTALNVVSTQKKDMGLAYIMISLVLSCKAAAMTNRDARDVWWILERLFQPVSEASTEFTQMHEIKMDAKDLIIEYSNKI